MLHTDCGFALNRPKPLNSGGGKSETTAKSATSAQQGESFMHKERLRMRTTENEPAGNRPAWFVSFLLLLAGVTFSTSAVAAPAKGAKPASAKTSQTAPVGDFVGQEVCATCHEEVSKGFR